MARARTVPVDILSLAPHVKPPCLDALHVYLSVPARGHPGQVAGGGLHGQPCGRPKDG